MEAGTGPPVKKVGDGAPRRGEDPERSFQWYTPKKRRATMYEDVTMDTQPSIHRHLDRGWPVHFEDGRGLWSEDSTRLRATRLVRLPRSRPDVGAHLLPGRAPPTSS